MAKKIILGLIMTVLASGLVFAQETPPDVIVMKSGEEIEAVIQEIGLDSVRYTRASSPGGPAYTVPKSEIFMIRYANGEQESPFDVIVMKSGEEIEAAIQEISLDSVRYTRASSPNGPAYTIPKSEIFMIRYANGERDVFANNRRSSFGGFGGSSSGSGKKHRFGASFGIGGLKSKTETNSLTVIDFGGSYSYMFRDSIGLTFNLRPFFGWYKKDTFTQNDAGFQGMAGIRYIFPAVYKTAGGRQINPYAAGKIGLGYLSIKNTLKIETMTTKTDLGGTGFCFELEVGAEMDSHFYIAFVYNFQSGKLDGKMTMTVSMGGNEDSESVDTSAESKGNFVGVRVGYQF